MAARGLSRGALVMQCLFLAAVLLSSVAGALYLRAAVTAPARFQVRAVSVDSVPVRVTVREVADILGRHCAGRNLITLDMAPALEELSALPWVAKVTLAKHYPDTLVAHVSEHVPSALWRENGLFDARSRQVFYPGGTPDFPLLRLMAPHDSEAPEIYDLAVSFMGTVREYRLQVVSVGRDGAGVITLTLSSGTRLILGRDNAQHVAGYRLRRFLEAARQSGLNFADLDYADLRYDSGFAVKVRETSPSAVKPAQN